MASLVAIVLQPDLDLVGKARVDMRFRAKSSCSRLMVSPTTLASNVLAANSAKPPQPQPISSTLSPCFMSSDWARL